MSFRPYISVVGAFVLLGCSGAVVEADATGSGGESSSGSSTGPSTTGTASNSDSEGPTTGTAGEADTEGTADPTTTTTSDPTDPTDPTDEPTTTGEPTTGEPTTEPTDTDPTATDSDTDTDTGNSSQTDTDTDSDTDTDTGTTGEPEPECECADVEVPLDNGIFVLSDDAVLWKYIPEFNTFENLGPLGCGLPNTFSMAVDRAGFAWVMFNSPQGAIRQIDVTDPSNCTDPGYVPGQMGATLFGMAFVSEDLNNQCDQLYGNTYNGMGGFSEGPNQGDFLTIDPDVLQTQILGPTTFNGAELTGSGDGRAFMFGGVPAKLVEVDKQTGEYLEVTPLGGLDLTNAFAFAFFAGDFYFFTESAGPGSNSKVTHFDYDDSDNNGIQDLTEVNAEGPLRVVGAGVSTCAPFNPM